MAIRLIEVRCPECEAADSTQVEIDEDSNDYFVNTICVECTNPYAIRIQVRIEALTYRLVRSES